MRLEQIVGELRELTRAEERRVLHEERRQHFDIAVLSRVHLQHEMDERTLEPRRISEQHRETRSGELRRTLEVEQAEPFADLPVRLRCEVVGLRLAPGAHDLVVFGALPVRHGRKRHVRNAEEPLLELGSGQNEIMSGRATVVLDADKVAA